MSIFDIFSGKKRREREKARLALSKAVAWEEAHNRERRAKMLVSVLHSKMKKQCEYCRISTQAPDCTEHCVHFQPASHTEASIFLSDFDRDNMRRRPEPIWLVNNGYVPTPPRCKLWRD